MKEITLFLLNNCPHCKLALRLQEELLEEHPAWRDIPPRMVDEAAEPAYADTFDYYYVPCYYVDGVKYHHIIDPETLYPATLWRAVTVVCEDSGLADALSTSLFTMTQDEGQALLDEFGAEALWVAADGQLLYSPGFSDYIKE